MNQEYEPPTITELGSVTELTQGQSTGSYTDQAFPAMTPFDQLTFSG